MRQIMRKWAELVGLCGICPIMFNRIIQRSLVETTHIHAKNLFNRVASRRCKSLYCGYYAYFTVPAFSSKQKFKSMKISSIYLHSTRIGEQRLSCRPWCWYSVTTFVNTHTVWHYLQMPVLSSNKTLSTECYLETSINYVFCSVVILFPLSNSSLDDFYIINFILFLHFIPCCMCICHMCIKIPTYLLEWIDLSACVVCLCRPAISSRCIVL